MQYELLFLYLVQATGARLGTMCQALCSVGVGVIIGFIFSWKLTLVILGFAPVLFLSGLVQTQMSMGTAETGQGAVEEAGKVMTVKQQIAMM